MFKLIVAGGRDYEPTEEECRKIIDVLYENIDVNDFETMLGGAFEIVTGGEKGVDTRIHEWAEYMGYRTQVFKADWYIHGKAAGPIRNRQMAEYADAVVLLPGGRGTQSMFKEATEAGIRIYDWRDLDGNQE